MNRTTAIIITAVTALCCGLPGLGLMCLGTLAAMGSQMPEAMAGNPSTPEEVLIGAVMFLCVGLILLVIPLVAGVVSFKMAKPAEPVYFGEEIPPTS
jgi:hypothetical protein